MAVILAIVSVWVYTHSDESSYVFVDLGSLDLYMISAHLTVDLSCCASVSKHGVAWSVQVCPSRCRMRIQRVLLRVRAESQQVSSQGTMDLSHFFEEARHHLQSDHFSERRVVY